jgi:hypothetical protein
MSWSVSAVGKPAAVAVKLAGAFTTNKCMEPEETIRQQVGQIIAKALEVFPADTAVNVSASGSQQSPKGDGKFINQLSVKIEPIYGFAE